MDGVAGLTQDPVPPGATFDYAFTAPDAGTYWYHPHFRSWEQLARGLYGLLIVDEEAPPPVDRDLFFVADDWRLTDEGSIDEASLGNLHDWAHAGRLGNFLTINGRSGPEIKVRAGERIRLRCVNVANARVLAFNFDRLTPRVIAVDGQPVPAADIEAGGLVLAPGQRTDLVIDVTGDAGSHIPVWEVSTGTPVEAARLVIADGPPLRPQPPAEPVALSPNPLLGGPRLGDAQGIELVMEGGAMGGLREATFEGEVLAIRDLVQKGLVWAFNGVAGKPLKPLAVVPRGRTATLNMVNRTRWPHAMHLHGHHFRVVERDGRPVTGAPWRDTELVAPNEQVRVAFVADNPGKWLLHCHMLEHQAAGMVTWLEVT
jgi:FtsP/CotA-like multicopper oxidase with cupredoxin domain